MSVFLNKDQNLKLKVDALNNGEEVSGTKKHEMLATDFFTCQPGPPGGETHLEFPVYDTLKAISPLHAPTPFC